ncbi:SUMO protein smt3 [Saxophila tyrrhenica]|uniref:SUMO protein smt3 n=1 Tax=Saxophila tyrrhenica TaxID=1690608 RepID=A0AAV9NWA6_9PEZI|nr:SUMO protein smt3 [Saxophila tyrrhenica]
MEDIQQPNEVTYIDITVEDEDDKILYMIKPTTKLKHLMAAFCRRRNKAVSRCQLWFEGKVVDLKTSSAAVGIKEGGELWCEGPYVADGDEDGEMADEEAEQDEDEEEEDDDVNEITERFSGVM